MKPENKAFEILEQYLTIFEVFGVRTAFNKKSYDKAVKCALICVDRIIDSIPLIPVLEHVETITDRLQLSQKYWIEVKEAIKKL